MKTNCHWVSEESVRRNPNRKMPGLLETCKKLFKTKDLYKVLEISKDATASEGI